jgi:hypothetical protein
MESPGQLLTLGPGMSATPNIDVTKITLTVADHSSWLVGSWQPACDAVREQHAVLAVCDGSLTVCYHLTLARVSVPCCGGLPRLVEQAMLV